MTKEMGNEKLMRVISDGFTEQREYMDKRFESVETEVRQGFVKTEKELENINLQLEQIKPAQERIHALESRVGSLESMLKQIQLQLKA